MEQPFDIDSARLTSKRPAEPDSSFGGESKRPCLRPLDGSFDFDPLQDWSWIAGNTLPDTSYVIPPAGAPVGASPELARISPQYPNHPSGYSDLSVNTVPISLPFPDQWPVLTEYGSMCADSSEPALPIPRVSSTPSYLGPAHLTSENAPNAVVTFIESQDIPALDTTANSWAGCSFSSDFTAAAYQLVPESDNSLNTSSTLTNFDITAPSVLGSTTLACASWNGGDASPLVKVEVAVVDPTPESTPSPSPLASSPEFASSSVMEAAATIPLPLSTPKQKQPSASQPDNPQESDSSDHRASKAGIDYDACFGVIFTKAVSSAKSQDDREATATVSLLGNVLKLSFRDTGKYAGLVTSEPLAKVMRDFSVCLTARVLPPERPAGKKPKNSFQHEEASVSVRVLVCGLRAEMDAVGSILSDHDLFFQHPFPSELDKSVPYLNPHYLLPPGAQMPDLDQLSLSNSRDTRPVEVLGDVAKARLMRVFDLFYDPGLSIEAKPSQRLKSTLKRHQLSALAMMTEKECGIIEDAKFPTLWETSAKHNGDRCYRHRITGIKEDHPCPQNGGLLADDMGLGKTLTALALICLSPDSDNIGNHDDQADADIPRTTLIVAPKSTLPGWRE